MTEHERWRPVRRGRLYCSPACGAKCTKAAHDRALRSGQRLADRLNHELGPGWSFEVWENMGWFYQAVKCTTDDRHLITVREMGSGTSKRAYTASFNTMVQQVADADTPEGAVLAAKRMAHTVARRISRDIRKVEAP